MVIIIGNFIFSNIATLCKSTSEAIKLGIFQGAKSNKVLLSPFGAQAIYENWCGESVGILL